MGGPPVAWTKLMLDGQGVAVLTRDDLGWGVDVGGWDEVVKCDGGVDDDHFGVGHADHSGFVSRVGRLRYESVVG
jgi:hypothetical protein